MELPSKSIIELLTYLLPGFTAVEILYLLTPGIRRRTPLERIVQALILTMIVQASVYLIQLLLLFVGRYGLVLGSWSEGVRLVWSVIVAGALGLLLAIGVNYDTFFRLLRRIGITGQTSYSSEWCGAFSEHDGHVVLHLVGQRRVFGWPVEWPNRPDVGHIVLSEVEWIDGETLIPATGVEHTLIKATDIEMVEFMYRDPSQFKEIKRVKPQATDEADKPRPTRQRDADGEPHVPSAAEA